MKFHQIFIFIPSLLMMSLISACDRQIAQEPVAAIIEPINTLDSTSQNLKVAEEDCLDEHRINISESSPLSRLSSMVALSCPIKY